MIMWQAVLLAEQCEARNLKLCQYKCRVEETWALARDEAAKCKAAKDVIKILKNQVRPYDICVMVIFLGVHNFYQRN